MDDAAVNDLVVVLRGFVRIIDAILGEDTTSISPAYIASQTFDLLTDTVRLYERAKPRQRAVLRAMTPIEINRILTWHFIPHLVDHFSQVPNRERLRTALLAISLDNKHWDYRDTLVDLGRLYRAAIGSGIDPIVEFRDIAAISDRGNGSHPTGDEETWNDAFPMHAFMARFEESAHFQEDVKPFLSGL